MMWVWWLGFWLALAPGRAAGPELTWLWANPQAHGNNIYDLAYRPGLTVQVGDRGQLYTSLERDLWFPHETKTSKALRGVTLFQERVVAVGEEGTVVYADVQALTNVAVPEAFTRIELPTADWLESVAASETMAVAVGDNGAIYTSPDGASWTRRPQSFKNWLRYVTYGHGIFLTVGEGGLIATSLNGVDWTRRSSGTTVHLNRASWVGSQCFIVGNQGLLLSSANTRLWTPFPRSVGTTSNLHFVTGTSYLGEPTSLLVGGDSVLSFYEGQWTDATGAGLSFPAPRWSFYAGFWDGLYYVVGGACGVFLEGFQTQIPGPCHWVSPFSSMRTWLWDVSRVGGLYLAVGDLGTIQTSSDGIRWSLEIVPPVATNAVLLGVGGRPGLLVAVGSRGTLLTSSNGVTWAAVRPPPVANDLQGVAVRDGTVFVTGGAGTVLSSADGLAWAPQNHLTSSFLSSIADSPHGLVCVGEDGAIFASPDGARWAARASATTNWLSRVRFLEDRFIALGEKGTILTSPDGKEWAASSSGTTAWLNDVARFNDRFYALGTQGTVLASADALHWDRIPVVTQKSLYGAVADHRQLLAVGVEGVILRGQPGALTVFDYRRLQTTNTFRISGPPGRRLYMDASTELAGWEPLVPGQFLDNSGSVLLQESRNYQRPHEFYRARRVSD